MIVRGDDPAEVNALLVGAGIPVTGLALERPTPGGGGAGRDRHQHRPGGGDPVIVVELRKLFRRPRTWATIGVLNALPILVAVLLVLTDLAPRPGEGPPFLSAVLRNGALYPLAALAIVLPLFLPIAVAVVAGDSIAGEAQAGTLRYLLARPAGRTRLLVAKLVAVLAFVVVTVVIVAGVGYVLGSTLFDAAADRRDVGVGDVADLVGAGAGGRVLADRLRGRLDARGRRVRAVLLHADRLPARARRWARWRCWSRRRCCSPSTPPRRSRRTCRRGTGWRSSTSSATRSCGGTSPRGLALQGVYVGVLLAAAWANFTTKDVTS